ncbi:MAG: MoxR family ATPase, partial [Acidimicrobiales bacterium]|nr:MoxR family ATPase [Acidimicrobiales bacterium]
YPDASSEAEVLGQRALGGRPPVIGPVLEAAEVETMIRISANVHVDDAITRYVVELTRASRTRAGIRLGLSTRGALALVRSAQARAISQGRAFVVPQDIKEVAPAVVGHRLVLTPEAEVEGAQTPDVVAAILDSVPVPVSG